MSNALGWNNMFTLKRADNNTQLAPRMSANKLPFKASMAFQTTTKVNAPNSAGKNRTQNSVLPRALTK